MVTIGHREQEHLSPTKDEDVCHVDTKQVFLPTRFLLPVPSTLFDPWVIETVLKVYDLKINVQ